MTIQKARQFLKKVYNLSTSLATDSYKNTNTSTSSRSTRQPVSYKFDAKKIMATETEWLTAGKHRIHAWSISGFESCVVAHGDGFKVAFDMGYPTRPAMNCQHVFISHGHIDHISGIVQHAARRSLFALKPATYYVPPHLKDPLQTMATSVGQLHGVDEEFSKIHIQTITQDHPVKLPGGILVKSFPTSHRVISQGYIVYASKRQLKPEYTDLPGLEIGRLIKAGVEVNDIHQVPELAYTGDTKFEIFHDPPHLDLLKVKTLITEATYIDDEVDRYGKNAVERARDRGHAHLQELVDSKDLFVDVSNIILIHFSDKYSVKYLHTKSQEILPDDLKDKVQLGTLMKEKMG